MDNAVTIATLRETVLRVAEAHGLSRQQVSITFDTFSNGDAFTITLTVPPADGRQRHDNRVSGTGDDLPAAEAALARRWEAHLVIEAEDATRRRARGKIAR
jgi:hypothetical protein